MRTIIAGGREITDPKEVILAVEKSGFEITTIISGGARGVDSLAIDYAFENDIEYEVFKADWDRYGRSAGPRRNQEMAENADALIAIWDGESRGTANMIDTARKLNLKVFVSMVN